MTFDPEAAWAALEENMTDTPAAKAYRHYRPFVDAAASFVKEAQDRNRIYTGIAQFDEQMRGVGSGQLLVVTGYSHSGKTQVITRMLKHNKDKRIAFFIPDEPATLVLSKLASIESGVPARELEERVSENDETAIRILRDTALRDYPNLAVFDKPLEARVMEEGLVEAEQVLGGIDLVIVDYVDLLTAGETVQSKFDFIKGFGSRHEVPVVAIHQTSRSAGAAGRKMTISSGNYGGEQHATFMIGVWRKKAQILAELDELRPKAANGNESAMDKVAELEHDLAIHQYTISANLVKNKRPGGSTLEDGLDFEIDVTTGQLHDLAPGELPRQRRMEVKRQLSTPHPSAEEFKQEYPSTDEFNYTQELWDE